MEVADGAGDARSSDCWKIIHQLAGVLGVDPGPFTLRELEWMFRARRDADFDQTALVCAVNANIQRDPKRKPKPYLPTDFHPFRTPPKSIERRIRGHRAFLSFLSPQQLAELYPHGVTPSAASS